MGLAKHVFYIKCFIVALFTKKDHFTFLLKGTLPLGPRWTADGASNNLIKTTTRQYFIRFLLVVACFDWAQFNNSEYELHLTLFWQFWDIVNCLLCAQVSYLVCSCISENIKPGWLDSVTNLKKPQQEDCPHHTSYIHGVHCVHQCQNWLPAQVAGVCRRTRIPTL